MPRVSPAIPLFGEPKSRARQKCAVQFCPAPACRTVLHACYCEACADSVRQAQYMTSLTPEAAEVVAYRHTFATAAPAGVTLPEPLSRPDGRRSRR